MELANALGEFLRARRELAQPGEHGLPHSGRRRVPGLRREELAMLAGISPEYYVRLERGRDRNPSSQILDALSRVLDLDAESRAYLDSLVTRRRLSNAAASGDSPVDAAIRDLLDAMPRVPAFVVGRFLDVLACNRAAEVLHGRSLQGNLVRYVFLDPDARNTYPDWPAVAAETVASLRASTVGHREEPRLVTLVGELSLKSNEFAQLWARHDVRSKTTGSKVIDSPAVGRLTVQWHTLGVNSAPGQLLVTYAAEPGSASASALADVADMAAGTAAREAEGLD